MVVIFLLMVWPRLELVEDRLVSKIGDGVDALDIWNGGSAAGSNDEIGRV
jgi:hypothetical protein